MVDEYDEENIIGIRLAYDISELPVKDITNAIDVSGINNPIPVANEYNVDCINKDQTGSVASGGATESVTFTPPSGNAWIIRGLKFHTGGISGATSNTHHFGLYTEPEGIFLAWIESNYGDQVGFNKLALMGTSKKDPSDALTLMKGIHDNLILTPSIGLTIKYQNNSDADQNSDRVYRLIRQEVRKTS